MADKPSYEDLEHRVKELEIQIIDGKRAQEKTDHLNAVLRAIRNVNQLITRDKDRGRLLKGVFNSLIETRGYYNAWLALIDESGGLEASVEAGLGNDFLPMIERMKRGELTKCAQKALGETGVILVEDPYYTCSDCPLAKKYAGRGAMTKRLEYGGKVYGLLSTSIPRDLIKHEAEQASFEEVAGDIAFALYSIELEEERKQAVETLEAERKRLFALLDGLPAYVYLQGPDHSIRFANRVFRKQFGDPGGKPCYKVITGRDKPCPRCRPFEVFDTGEPLEWEWAQRDGRTYQIYDYPFSDIDGTALVLELGIDITERKRAQREKRELEAQFLQAQRLEALAALSGGVVHNFNNILMGIQAEVSLMLLKLDSEHPNYTNLRSIKDLVRSGSGLANQLLDFARVAEHQVKPTEINRLVSSTSDMFAHTKQEIRIHRRFQENLWYASVDYGQIEQVLLNLFLNAADAMPDGGDLYVETRNITFDEKDVKPYQAKPGEYVKISVMDTGVGMDKKIQAKVFDPFFTTKEGGKGTGLGLSSAYGIIKKHGGIINVQSEKGKGTTFTIYLPASKQAVEQ